MLVEVSTNGREYTSSGVQFELVSVMMQDLTPYLGPVLGGTVVTIAGTGLSHAADSLHCRFGDGLPSVAASAHGSDGVRCVSPPSVPVGFSVVVLTAYGVQLRSAGSFMGHLAMYVSELVPPAGPVSGGTRVTVLGGTFKEVSTLRCRFEGSSMTSTALRISNEQLECASPPSSGAGSRRVSLSMNAQQFSLERR